MNIPLADLSEEIEQNVRTALAEDVGSGDITAMLIDADSSSSAEIVTREDCVVCGIAWVNETFKQLGGVNTVHWRVKDGDIAKANTKLAELQGSSRSLLTGERTALNFLQLLSGVATKAHHYAELVKGSNTRILDTRKTLPGLRRAQKYAVACGGSHNHRIGLFDAFLIKENHIAACGGIKAAIDSARKLAPGKPVEVEVETLDELQIALESGADIVMLDNFSDDMLAAAMKIDRKATKFEVSGNLSAEALKGLKKLNIDFCSFGSLTKNVNAIDLSMRLYL